MKESHGWLLYLSREWPKGWVMSLPWSVLGQPAFHLCMFLFTGIKNSQFLKKWGNCRWLHECTIYTWWTTNTTQAVARASFILNFKWGTYDKKQKFGCFPVAILWLLFQTVTSPAHWQRQWKRQIINIRYQIRIYKSSCPCAPAADSS